MINLRQLLSNDSQLDNSVESLLNFFKLSIRDSFVKFLSESSGNDSVNNFLKNCMNNIAMEFSLLKTRLTQFNSNDREMRL